MEEKIPIDYSAVVLDEKSINRLLQRFGDMIPEGWKLISDKHPDDPYRTMHMTISLGEIPSHLEKYLELPVKLWIVDYGMENGVFAVGVTGMESKNKKPHITVAIDEKSGAKPVDSNNIKNWVKIKRPLLVVGKVKEVPNEQYVALMKMRKKNNKE